MPLPWEEFQPQKSERLPWQDYQATTVDPATNQPPGVPAFAPPGVEGYDPQTGEVQQYGQGDSAAMGAADATTFGWGDELASYVGSGLYGVPREQVLREMRGNASQAQSENPGSYLAGQVGGGLAQALATLGGGAASAVARGGGTLGKVALGSAVDGALYGGAYGSGSADDSGRLQGGVRGGLTGLAIGGAAPLVAAGVGKAARKVISPFAGSPEREAAVRALAQEGVPVTAGQRTGSNALRYAESEIGGSKAATAMETQAERFTEAVMRKAGASGRATPDNLAALKGNMGQAFEDIAARNTLVADRQLGQDLGKTLNRYSKLLETQQKPIIDNLASDIVTRLKATGGKLSGTEYQTIRSDLTSAASSTTNQTLASAMRGLRNALDDAMDRSINPADAGAWKVLRKQYGNMKVLQRASVGGGADSGLGLISPAQLRTAAATGNREGFATGASDFTDLAKAGQAVMTPLPNSGTASRLSARSLGAMAPTILGAGYGGASGGDLQSALAGAAAGYGLQKGAGMALMNPAVQRYLGNQAATGPANRVSEALLAAILRDGGIQALLGSR